MPNSFVSWLSGEKHACGLVESIKTSVILMLVIIVGSRPIIKGVDVRLSKRRAFNTGVDVLKILGPMNTVPQETDLVQDAR